MASMPPVRSPSPLPRLLLLLSGTTGLIDAASILGLGKVFTANMTGNVVFLGFAVAGAPGFKPLPYLVSLAAFVVGAAAAGRLGQQAHERPLRNWLMKAACTESALLVAATAIGSRFDVGAQKPQWALVGILLLTASAMGFRNATVRQLKVPDLTTTVLTLTITAIAADSRLGSAAGAHFGIRLAAMAAIFTGAAMGALLFFHLGLAPTFLLTALLVLIGTTLCTLHPLAAQPYRP